MFDTKEDVGKRLREARIALNLTLTEFVAKTGIPQSTLSSIEIGKAKPASDTISKLLNIGLSIDWLLTGKGEMFNNGKSLKLENITDEGELIEQIVVMLETKLKEDNTELPIKKKAEFIKEMFIDCRHLAKKEAQDKIISILKYIS